MDMALARNQTQGRLSGSKQAEEESPIMKTLSALMLKAQGLYELECKLADRLGPVMSPSVPMLEAEPPPRTGAPGAPMMVRLHDLDLAVDGCEGLVRSLMDRLQI